MAGPPTPRRTQGLTPPCPGTRRKGQGRAATPPSHPSPPTHPQTRANPPQPPAPWPGWVSARVQGRARGGLTSEPGSHPHGAPGTHRLHGSRAGTWRWERPLTCARHGRPHWRSRVALTVCCSPCAAHRVPSPCAAHRVLSPCPGTVCCHHVPSPCAAHLVLLTVSRHHVLPTMSPSPCTPRRVPVTVCCSPCPHHCAPPPCPRHCAPLIVGSSPCPHHRVPLTVSPSPCPAHHVPLTVRPSPCPHHCVPLTLASRLPRRVRPRNAPH